MTDRLQAAGTRKGKYGVSDSSKIPGLGGNIKLLVENRKIVRCIRYIRQR